MTLDVEKDDDPSNVIGKLEVLLGEEGSPLNTLLS